MKLLSPIYNLLSILAVIIFIFMLFAGNQTFDVHIHAKYYIIGLSQFLKLNAFILLAIWMIYKLADKSLYSEKLTRVHVIVTAAAVGLISVATYCRGIATSSSVSPNSMLEYMYWAIPIALILFALAQLILIFNVAAGLSGRKQ